MYEPVSTSISKISFFRHKNYLIIAAVVFKLPQIPAKAMLFTFKCLYLLYSYVIEKINQYCSTYHSLQLREKDITYIFHPYTSITGIYFFKEVWMMHNTFQPVQGFNPTIFAKLMDWNPINCSFFCTLFMSKLEELTSLYHTSIRGRNTQYLSLKLHFFKSQKFMFNLKSC